MSTSTRRASLVIAALSIAGLSMLAAGLREGRPAPGSSAPGPSAVEAMLDDWHDAASRADGVRYFGHMTGDAVFLGTDATERWSLDEFKAFAKPYFDQGRGWTYLPRERHVMLSRDGTVAWFDEVLDNAKFGECRGTGVAVRDDDEWKIAHYNLTVPIPNDLLPGFADKIREFTRKAPVQPKPESKPEAKPEAKPAGGSPGQTPSPKK